MTNKFKFFLKPMVALLVITFILTGCSKAPITGSDFEDVVYEIKLDVSENESVDTNSSENEPIESMVSNVNSLPDNSSSNETSSDDISSDETVSNTESEEEEYKDPTYLENLPKLLNPNGFNINSIGNVSMIECFSKKWKPSDFIPTVAYLENGVAKDMMFDGFIFMGGNSFFYDYGDTDGGRRALTQKDWENLIYSNVFREGYNVDALDNAVGQAKEALEMPDYKAGVYLAISYPSTILTNWGEVDGKILNLADNPEDRITATKWVVDEYIKAFNAKKYENVELCGFYYFNETCSKEDKVFLNPITDYIRSLKYITIWCPYFQAAGYDIWQELGFDKAVMQANYFPGTNLPNNGGISRVSIAAAITASRGMGLEIELAGLTATNIGGMKEYFRVGVTTGCMNRFKMWWISGHHLTSVKSLYNSKDSYIHSAYREMYLYIKCKLQVSDITSE